MRKIPDLVYFIGFILVGLICIIAGGYAAITKASGADSPFAAETLTVTLTPEPTSTPTLTVTPTENYNGTIDALSVQRQIMINTADAAKITEDNNRANSEQGTKNALIPAQASETAKAFQPTYESALYAVRIGATVTAQVAEEDHVKALSFGLVCPWSAGIIVLFLLFAVITRKPKEPAQPVAPEPDEPEETVIPIRTGEDEAVRIEESEIDRLRQYDLTILRDMLRCVIDDGAFKAVHHQKYGNGENAISVYAGLLDFFKRHNLTHKNSKGTWQVDAPGLNAAGELLEII